jgi:hypothetical protein
MHPGGLDLIPSTTHTHTHTETHTHTHTNPQTIKQEFLLQELSYWTETLLFDKDIRLRLQAYAILNFSIDESLIYLSPIIREKTQWGRIESKPA